MSPKVRTVSHYELLEKLGEGGMGVVWKARDARLERLVAVKFLPPEKIADAERRRRFTQEARAASALNHPRIITIYDIDHTDGADFIVMEYVSGKTLEDLIPPKGMKIEEAIRYGMQIADALAAAHAAGIVHRDLKPANVMVSDAGQVKVLDFGLAKLQEETVPSSEAENTRTIAVRGRTEDGTIVGTTSYMSPEQAEGKKVDARSDIFSFGAVLYEMLTGKRAFRGDSKMSTLAAILRAQPEPVDKVVEGVPRELAKIVQRCLRKDPEDRAQSMADLRIALKDLKEESESGLLAGSPAPPAARRRRKAFWIGAGLAAVLVIAGAAYLSFSAAKAPEPPLTATLLTSYPGLERWPSFSPDGNQVAFGWSGEHQDNQDIYVKLLGPGKPLRLTTDPAPDLSPAWSPDGRWIAFIRGNALLLIPPIGGVEREVARGLFRSPTEGISITRAPVVSWSPDSRWIIACMREREDGPLALFLVSAETGEKRRLTNPSKTNDYFGSISPDGKNLVFCRVVIAGTPVMSEADLWSVSLGGDYAPKGEPTRVTSEGVLIEGLAWTADSSEIVFSSYKGGYAALWRIAIAGSHHPVKLSVGENGVAPTIARDGHRMAFEQTIGADLNIWRLSLTDPAQAPATLIASTRPDQSSQYSPDGTKIVFSSERSGPSAIWVCDADGGNAVQLTDMRASGSPSWSPDGQRIAFDSVVESKWQIFTVSARGGRAQQLTFNSPHTRPWWSHDGQWIYATGNGGIQKIPAAGGNPIQFTPRGGNPVESPDGKTVYFTKDAGIWKVGTDGAGEAVVIREAPASAVAVAQDGFYYYSGQRANREIAFFSFATRQSRTIRSVGAVNGNGLSVSPDGKWLLYLHRDGEAAGDLMLVDPFR